MEKYQGVSSSQSAGKLGKSGKRKSSGLIKEKEEVPVKKFTSSVDALNSAQLRKLLNLTSMEKRTPYRILKSRMDTTKFGERILLTLENHQELYLPERYNSLYKHFAEDMNKGKFVLINKGQVGKGYDLSFKEAGEDVQK